MHSEQNTIGDIEMFTAPGYVQEFLQFHNAGAGSLNDAPPFLLRSAANYREIGRKIRVVKVGVENKYLNVVVASTVTQPDEVLGGWRGVLEYTTPENLLSEIQTLGLEQCRLELQKTLIAGYSWAVEFGSGIIGILMMVMGFICAEAAWFSLILPFIFLFIFSRRAGTHLMRRVFEKKWVSSKSYKLLKQFSK